MVQINGYTITLDNSHYIYDGKVIGQHSARVEKEYRHGGFISWHNDFVSAIRMVKEMKGF